MKNGKNKITKVLIGEKLTTILEVKNRKRVAGKRWTMCPMSLGSDSNPLRGKNPIPLLHRSPSMLEWVFPAQDELILKHKGRIYKLSISKQPVLNLKPVANICYKVFWSLWLNCGQTYQLSSVGPIYCILIVVGSMHWSCTHAGTTPIGLEIE